MSRIGKKAIDIAKDVKVNILNNNVEVCGPRGKLTYCIPFGISVEVKDNKILVSRQTDTKKDKSLHGLVRSLIFNMVEGVTKGYSKTLEIVGSGFRAQLQGGSLSLSLGFSHPVKLDIPKDITIETPKATVIVVKGIDKAKVGQVAADIRAVLPPEPYKGKGIRYSGEYVRKKLGKAAITTGK